MAVCVAWVPILVEGPGLYRAGLQATEELFGALVRQDRTRSRLGAKRPDESPEAWAFATRRSGVVTQCISVKGADAVDVLNGLVEGNESHWSVAFISNASEIGALAAIPTWQRRGSGDDWTDETYAAGWPWVMFTASGDPSFGNPIYSDNRTPPAGRGWIVWGEPKRPFFNRAVPARLYWPGAVLSSLAYGSTFFAIVALARRGRTLLRVRRGHCPACGYDLRGNPGGGCPECGVS